MEACQATGFKGEGEATHSEGALHNTPSDGESFTDHVATATLARGSVAERRIVIRGRIIFHTMWSE